MYEAPKLDVVGEVDDIILGIASLGWDIDGCLIIDEHEYGSSKPPHLSE
jgi:hypothetical protein